MAGNLGDYHRITSLAKQVGGPKVLGAITLFAGAVIYEVSRRVTMKIAPAVKAAIAKRTKLSVVTDQLFAVSSDGEAGGGLTLHAGDRFRVLEYDGDSILIEVVGDDDNPYFVSGELLLSISDFEAERESGAAS